jgi:hypothetical protein
MPLPCLNWPTVGDSTHYAITAIDASGRLADRSPLAVLRWPAGLHVTFAIMQGAVAVTADREARQTITRQGHLRLPATARHIVRAEAGHRLLMAACITVGVLLVCPTAVLDPIIAAHLAIATDRETP